MSIANTILQGDALEVLKTLPDNSVQCCVTSPPYWGLRNYGVDGQLGLEKTPEEYIAKMVAVFNEVKRVLKPTGTLWLNIGDSYAGSGKGAATHPGTNGQWKQGTNKGTHNAIHSFKSELIKPKDLIGIPWMLAFALRAQGWYLRQEIIWAKPNPMPESVTDRCTKAHEQIFLLTKSPKYYFDAEAIKTESKDPAHDFNRQESQTWDNKNTPDKIRNGIRPKTSSTFGNRGGALNGVHSGKNYFALEKANKRSVWTVPTSPFSEAHFATFPEDLIVDCIKAGCPKDGLVLDPFSGACTTALVSAKLGRQYIGIELNPEYIAISRKRLQKELGMFNPTPA